MRNQLERWLMRHQLPAPSASKEEKREFFDAMPAPVKREWQLRKAAKECEAPDYNIGTADRAARRMARVDAMPRATRELVYEYGLEIIQEFLNCGVKVHNIKHLIDTVRHSDFENGQRRFKINKGPNTKRNPIEDEDEYYAVKR